MKAIVVREFGSPDVMKLENVPEPAPGPGQVTIRVHAAGVNPVDTYIRAGAYARKPNLPYTPGTDVGGVVHAVGADVTRVRAGDRVYGHAVDRRLRGGRALRGMAGAPAAAGVVIPAGSGDRRSLRHGVARAADAGAGAARRDGARPRRQRRRGNGRGADRARLRHACHRHGRNRGGAGARPRQGAHHVLNHRDADYLQRVPPLTDGQGVDVVLEMLANVNLDRDLDLLAPHGRVVVIGNRGRVEIDPRKSMARDATILGMTLFNATREHLEEIHAGIVAGLENGSLNPVIGKEFPLADAAKAHVAVMESGALGKIVLVP